MRHTIRLDDDGTVVIQTPGSDAETIFIRAHVASKRLKDDLIYDVRVSTTEHSTLSIHGNRIIR